MDKKEWRRAWQPTPVFLTGESSLDRSAWQATVHRVTQSQTRLKLLSTHAPEVWIRNMSVGRNISAFEIQSSN